MNVYLQRDEIQPLCIDWKTKKISSSEVYQGLQFLQNHNAELKYPSAAKYEEKQVHTED